MRRETKIDFIETKNIATNHDLPDTLVHIYDEEGDYVFIPLDELMEHINGYYASISTPAH